uniref:ENTH domain-containing protein n=1 Tax=Clastoptera arizonana TaxID=38151 RepID=A0A1B6EA88_9HEMI
MWKVREIADKVTNVVMNYTDVEAKVREATNDDPWGPTGVLMQEVAQATFTYEHFPEVMTMLWKRMLQDNRKNWRRTYKSLLVLNYLVRNGSERVVTSSREHIYDLRSLENYTFVDEFGKDRGINVRHKVKELIEFIQDDDKLREERKKAKKNKDKYVGMSSDVMALRGGLVGDRWENAPRWMKEDVGEWDQDRGGGLGEESNNNSDEGERYDSEPDTSFPPPQSLRKSTSPAKEYKDTESIDSGNTNVPTGKISTPSRKPKTAIPSKIVDLGAAANYGKNQASKPSSGDLLGDLGSTDSPSQDSEDYFNPRSDIANKSFGNFSKAFGSEGASEEKMDEFADFTSAFTMSTPPSIPQIPSTNINAINAGLGNMSLSQPAFNPMLPTSNLFQTQNSGSILPNGKSVITSNADLLSGLSDDSNSMNPLADFSSQPTPLSSSMMFGNTLIPTTDPRMVLQSTPQDLSSKTAPLQVGSTWSNSGNLNINVDNLTFGASRGGKTGSAAPSMNQLASTPTSPQKQFGGFPQQMNMTSPTKPMQMNPNMQGYQPPGYFPAFK